MYRKKRKCPWCDSEKLDTFHVLSECTGLAKKRINTFEFLAKKLQKFDKAKTTTDFLKSRVKYEHESSESCNDPEEKASEIQPIRTSEGVFDTPNHAFVTHLFHLFGTENDEMREIICTFIVRFIDEVKDQYNRLSQDSNPD